MAQAPSLMGRALRYLARREHTQRELERKLAAHAESAEQLQALMQTLVDKDLLSEERAVESWVRVKAPRLGRARLQQELRQKGASEELIRQQLNQLESTESERAWQVWCKKFGDSPQTPQEHAKQVRFLVARGFGHEAVSQVMRRAQNPNINLKF